MYGINVIYADGSETTNTVVNRDTPQTNKPKKQTKVIVLVL